MQEHPFPRVAPAASRQLLVLAFCGESEKAHVSLSATSCVVDESNPGALGEFVAQCDITEL